MKSERFFDWIQIMTGVAVLIGLGLVVWELRQSQDIAEAQMLTDNFNNNTQLWAAAHGENVAEVLAKACTAPESMTDGEMAALSYLNQINVGLVTRAYLVEQTTGLNEGQWQQIAIPTFMTVFSNTAGREWWKVAANSGASVAFPAVRDLGDSILQSAGSPMCGKYYSDWKEGIRKAVQNT